MRMRHVTGWAGLVLAGSVALIVTGCGGESAPGMPRAVDGARDGVSAVGKVVFQSSRGTDTGIYTINADGSSPKRLSRTPATDCQPAWSPDGSRIVFVSGRGDPSGDLYSMKYDGLDVRRITHDSLVETDPAWCPTASMIAYAATKPGTGLYNIFTINANGNGRLRLTSTAATDHCPTWSPDGRKIAFQRTTRSRNADLYVMNTDGSGITRLTNDPGTEVNPAWSPDGRLIAYAGDGGGTFDLWVMNRDGTHQRRVTRLAGNEFHPAWSPNSASLAFARTVSLTSTNADIFTIAVGGKGLIQVTKSPAWDIDPDWWGPR